MKKKCFILAIFVILSLSLNAQQGESLDKQFYYYKGKKNYIAIDFSRISIVSKEKADVDNVRRIDNFPVFEVKNDKRSYTRQSVISVDELLVLR